MLEGGVDGVAEVDARVDESAVEVEDEEARRDRHGLLRSGGVLLYWGGVSGPGLLEDEPATVGSALVNREIVAGDGDRCRCAVYDGRLFVRAAVKGELAGCAQGDGCQLDAAIDGGEGQLKDVVDGLRALDPVAAGLQERCV